MPARKLAYEALCKGMHTVQFYNDSGRYGFVSSRQLLVLVKGDECKQAADPTLRKAQLQAVRDALADLAKHSKRERLERTRSEYLAHVASTPPRPRKPSAILTAQGGILLQQGSSIPAAAAAAAAATASDAPRTGRNNFNLRSPARPTGASGRGLWAAAAPSATSTPRAGRNNFNLKSPGRPIGASGSGLLSDPAVRRDLSRAFAAVTLPLLVRRKGWTTAQGSRLGDRYFMPPGVVRGRQRARMRVDYFDSAKQVLGKLFADEESYGDILDETWEAAYAADDSKFKLKTAARKRKLRMETKMAVLWTPKKRRSVAGAKRVSLSPRRERQAAAAAAAAAAPAGRLHPLLAVPPGVTAAIAACLAQHDRLALQAASARLRDAVGATWRHLDVPLALALQTHTKSGRVTQQQADPLGETRGARRTLKTLAACLSAPRFSQLASISLSGRPFTAAIARDLFALCPHVRALNMSAVAACTCEGVQLQPNVQLQPQLHNAPEALEALLAVPGMRQLAHLTCSFSDDMLRGVFACCRGLRSLHQAHDPPAQPEVLWGWDALQTHPASELQALTLRSGKLNKTALTYILQGCPSLVQLALLHVVYPRGFGLEDVAPLLSGLKLEVLGIIGSFNATKCLQAVASCCPTLQVLVISCWKAKLQQLHNILIKTVAPLLTRHALRHVYYAGDFGEGVHALRVPRLWEQAFMEASPSNGGGGGASAHLLRQLAVQRRHPAVRCLRPSDA
eukprot:TRINITY_DN277_c0_g1_i4.p1 TRINITY_DN277_c0_g1~~TRINITY_DN277_c0_g1_i4.p1  ORF type:complete len:842 (-),score=241.02 TRINITY_DN277_c0_g1_i4:1150-3360(-)